MNNSYVGGVSSAAASIILLLLRIISSWSLSYFNKI